MDEIKIKSRMYGCERGRGFSVLRARNRDHDHDQGHIQTTYLFFGINQSINRLSYEVKSWHVLRRYDMYEDLNRTEGEHQME